ncbi:Crp/Fnr family transcriptional regulator [Pontibacter pamirensis]|uniref:Crp/Fnr family transcriptional regulator n=1 Tax=Pontibacter pamirensis TaxID=2562824 RepID=UPI00138A22D8|nr:Crp/Fnr family transcriptional regulator [Pontibacter pamirensis]
MAEEHHKLKQLVNSIRPLPEEDWEAFSSAWVLYGAKRKESITVAGEKEHYLYFVVDGVQRVFYFDDEGREATLVFTYAPSFGGVLDSFMLQQPARYYYETLTPSVFLRATFNEMQQLMCTRPAIESMLREGITHSLSGLLQRLVELQCYTSEERFRKLLQRSPHILQLVPHKYLANYLGIDPTNFSKLLNKVRI